MRNGYRGAPQSHKASIPRNPGAWLTTVARRRAIDRLRRAAALEPSVSQVAAVVHEAGSYYPYHAARADLLRRTGQREAAADAFEQAITLCGNSAERAYLQRRLDEMLKLIA